MHVQVGARGGVAGPFCQWPPHCTTSHTARTRTMQCTAQLPQPSQIKHMMSRRSAGISIGASVLAAWGALQVPQSADAAAANPSFANSALMQKLQQRMEQDQSEDDSSPTLLDKFAEMQQQLQRIMLLVQIKQYDSARMQLRDKSFKTLRLALGYGSQRYYPVVTQQMTRDVLEQLELLDGALKRREGVDAVKPIVQQLTQRLQTVTDAINVVTAEAK